jgi:hypothetical protein
MSRQQRQRDELRGLCGSGAVDRAIDLAFAHFADFGRDEEVLALIAAAVGHEEAGPHLQRRFDELASTG